MSYAVGSYYTPAAAAPPPEPGGQTSPGTVVVVTMPFFAAGQRLIAVNTTTGEFEYADKDLAHAQSVVGMLLQAGTADLQMLLQGQYADPTLALDPTKPMWLGSNGEYTQVRPTTGLLMQVGKPLSATHFVLDLKPAIQLA
jgi:hypothetical protein